jgi:hypothetical protein
MVAEHYEKIGFSFVEEENGATVWPLDLAGYVMPDLFKRLTKVEQ